MPRGLNEPAHRVREAARAASAAIVAAGLVLTSAAAAQSTPAEEVAEPATSESGYPAPGQPVATPPSVDPETSTVEKSEGDVRVATLHADLIGEGSDADSSEQLISSLAAGNHLQARTLAQTVQINDPDVLVLTGVSYDEDHRIADLLRTLYLGSGQGGQSGMDYPYVFTAPTNSGLDSGADLDGDGTVGGPGDAVGYGDYPGQHGMIVFSKHPILTDEVRTFQNFLWRDLPESSVEDGGYSELEQSILRLHETSLWDVPVSVEGAGRLHVVASSLSPAEASGQADPARIEDQQQVLADYVSGDAWYLADDSGEEGGLQPDAPFVVAGLPVAGGHSEDPGPLTDTPAVQDPEQVAVTEETLEERPGSLWETHGTATRWQEEGQDLRSSYVLPSDQLEVTVSGIFWPGEGEYGYEVVDPESRYALEDRLVWVDVAH